MADKRGIAVLAVLAAIVALAAIGGFAIAEPEVDTGLPESVAVLKAAAALTPERPADLVHDTERNELVLLHGPVDLPAASGGHGHSAHGSDEAVFPDVAEVTVPIDGFIFGIYVDLVDRDGEAVPSELLHHVNVVDPDQRELFAPISMRVGAAGKETGVKGMPPRLFGVPVRKGQRLAIHTMLHNSTDKLYESVVLRFHLRLAPAAGPDPLFSVFPFWVDVQLPAGDKTFDLPPGRSSKSYEAHPAIPGRILALSGHMHENATGLRFENATTGEVLWEAAPELNEDGSLAGVPIGRPFLHLGAPVTPGNAYRLTVEYDNPTSYTIRDGGMGSIGGIFLPDRGVEWPTVDRTQELYQLDLKHYYRELLGKLADLREALPAGPGPQANVEDNGAAHAHPN